MLHNVKELKGCKLQGLDGEIGTVVELYFDDKHWTVRYLVAETGTWLDNRKVLISPYALGTVDSIKRHIDIDLTKQQIRDCPPVGSDKPVSRQYEELYYGYYGWPVYWGGPYMWGAYPYIVRDSSKIIEIADKETWDPNLRSTIDVTGHHIQAEDGEIGHVDDFVIDDETWAIRYLIINTSNWWLGKMVLVSPRWIKSVSWGEAKVFINLHRETIKHSPEYTELALLTRDYESELHRHYDREGYWIDEPVAGRRHQ